MSQKKRNPLDRRISRSHRALLDGAIDLLMINPGASLTDIAQHAGVGRATLYRHFDSREALLRELAIESLNMTDDVLQPIRDAGLNARETLEKGLAAIMQVADRFHFLLLLWNFDDGDTELMGIYQSQLDELSRLVEQGKQENSIDATLPTEWIVSMYDSLIYAGWYAIRSGSLNAEQAGRHAASTLFQGISPPP